MTTESVQRSISFRFYLPVKGIETLFDFVLLYLSFAVGLKRRQDCWCRGCPPKARQASLKLSILTTVPFLSRSCLLTAIWFSGLLSHLGLPLEKLRMIPNYRHILNVVEHWWLLDTWKQFRLTYFGQIVSNITCLSPATIGIPSYPIMFLVGRIQSRSCFIWAQLL